VNREKPGLIILDRDGTLIKHVDHLVDETLVQLIPGVGSNLKKLSDLGFEFAMATNQSVIARELATELKVQKINQKVQKLLAPFGVIISHICICPHLPNSACSCRKPNPGMGLEIFNSLGYDEKSSIMIGDNETDIQFADNLGISSIQFSESGQFSFTATINCSNWEEVYEAAIELLK
jgi:D-glycero-D-manno-heptose 1,7-bisphosphate phosphatase